MNRLVARLTELAGRAVGWSTLRDGVQMFRLAGDPDVGSSVALLRYRPGARIPPHRHPGFEVIYVIAGSQTDEGGTYPAGSVIVNPPGHEHRVWSEEGCTVLIVWEKAVEFLPE